MNQPNHNYPCILDFKPKFFLSWLLYRLFKRIEFDRNAAMKLKQLSKEGTVVYAIKYRGRLDYLLYHFRFKSARIPFPRVALGLNMSLVLPLSHLFGMLRFQISYFLNNRHFPNPYETGFFRQTIKDGTTSLFYLVDPKGFLRHFIHSEKDNLAFLLETQMEMDRPIYLIPQLVLYKKTPEKNYTSFFDIFFGYKDNPGLIRKIVLFFRHNRKAFIDFGPPLNLKAFLEENAAKGSLLNMSSKLRDELIIRIDEQKRVILGPIMKSRQQLKEQVLTDPEVAQMLKEIASSTKTPLKTHRKKASEYFDEIAADYNVTYLQFFERCLSWFWKKLFDGIDVSPDEMGRLRNSARKGALIYVPSHKSHIDYLVLNYVLLQHHMHVPRVAAGKNMAFWPMGHVFRKSGAFFIRRTFKGARLYAKIFSRYIKALLEEGHPLEFFIEGGRSRSGKLILPKTGFLSILLEAFKEGYCEDLLFVPASISYDRIMEEKSYIRELSGHKKEKESFRQLMRARQFFRRKYGKIYIRFAQPISLKQYLDLQPDPQQPVARQLALHIIRSINEISLVTPVALLATAILVKHRRGFNRSQLMDTVGTLLDYLKRQGAAVASTLSDPETAIQDALSVMVQWKVLKSVEAIDSENPYYLVYQNKKVELEYYRNNILHFFVPHGMVALSLLTCTHDTVDYETIRKDFQFLAHLFSNEFILEEKKVLPGEVTQILDYFLQNGWIRRFDGRESCEVSRLGLDLLPIWGNQIRGLVELYWIGTRMLLGERGKRTRKSERLKDMKNLAATYHKLGLIHHQESISEHNLENVLGFMEEHIFGIRSGMKTSCQEAAGRLENLDKRLFALSRYRP